MKKISLKIIKIFFLIFIILLIFILLIPFNMFDVEQAQRIAKWKSVYDKLDYSFALVKLHEGSIIPFDTNNDQTISEDVIIERFIPYLNSKSDKPISLKYKFKKLNGKLLRSVPQFDFTKFLITKNGIIIGIKQNQLENNEANKPLYLMFVDINGKQPPNIIGKDIFFINIYKDKILPLGNGKSRSIIKSNCSPIGAGFYCSEYYLHGGRF